MLYLESLKKRVLFNLLMFFVIVFLDQITKTKILSIVGLNNESLFIPGVIKFTVVQNTGGAFSIFKQYPVYFKIIGLANVLIFSYLAFCPTVSYSNLVKAGCACILGGTVGNLIDRFLRDGVIDFLDFQFISFAVFNLADVFIDIGVILILFGWYLSRKK